jgi:type IV pilus assembly protein PilE
LNHIKGTAYAQFAENKTRRAFDRVHAAGVADYRHGDRGSGGNYTRQVQKSRRTDAHSLLMRIAAEQERYFTNFNRYTADLTGGPPGGLGMAQVTSENGFYTATATVANANQTYQLTATPTGNQLTDNCGALTLNSSDQRTFAGNEDNGNCW